MTTTQLPSIVHDRYTVTVNRVQRLDSSGEFCPQCQLEDAYVEVQFYGTTIPECRALEPGAEIAFGECCLPCLPDTLMHANVDPSHDVTLEVEG